MHNAVCTRIISQTAVWKRPFLSSPGLSAVDGVLQPPVSLLSLLQLLSVDAVHFDIKFLKRVIVWRFIRSVIYCTVFQSCFLELITKETQVPTNLIPSFSCVCHSRSRLADFHMNCQMTAHTVTSCLHDNYHGCLMSYVGLLGNLVSKFKDFRD